MATVFFPITENATIQDILEISQRATQYVGQSYTIVTFDPGVAQKAYSIIWENHVGFGNVIIRSDVFHAICSLLGALGKHMQGSGFDDVVIESGICTSGSLKKVMYGKHYNRALRVHKLMLESLERLLFRAFENPMNCIEELSDDSCKAVDELSEKPNC